MKFQGIQVIHGLGEYRWDENGNGFVTIRGVWKRGLAD